MKRSSGLVKKILFSFCLLAAASALPAVAANINDYYKYPFSFGLGYQQIVMLNLSDEQQARLPSWLKLNVPSDLNYTFFLFDLGANIRLPLSFFPYLQPGLRAGIIQGFSKVDLEIAGREPDHDLYTHTHFYGMGGLHIVYRFSKNFEVGINGYAGFSRSFFPYVSPDKTKTLIQDYFIAEAGIQWSINPQYNLSLEFQPTLRYQRIIGGDFTALDGIWLAVNCSVNFRLREDPDLQKQIFKSLVFEKVQIDPAFAALQTYYAENPLGFITITNSEKIPLEDIRISFFQPGYMDSPTPAHSIARLQPGESRQVPLFAVFNQAVMDTEGMVPLSAEITLQYQRKGEQGQQKTSVVYNLHDKTSLTWDDDRKVAAFINPADSTIQDYNSQILQATRELTPPLFNQPLLAAMQIYNALSAAGCFYQADAVSPYTLVRENLFTVDSVQLPRETLKRRSGDCDDLTVLFLSLLEARGIETGFITIPGHIYPAFNTGLTTSEYRKLHPERNMSLIYRGELWIPIELTLLGTEDFLQAWSTGIRLYLQLNDQPALRQLYLTRPAQQVFNPLSLRREQSITLTSPTLPLVEGYRRDLNTLSQLLFSSYRQSIAKDPSPQNYLALGKILATFGREDEATQAFGQVLALDPASPFPRIYMGNLRFLARDYNSALEYYNTQMAVFTAAGDLSSTLYLRLLLRISITYYMLNDLTTAQEYYARAYELSPEQARSYTYLAGNFSHSTRGSRQSIFELYPPFAEESEEP